MKKKKQDSKNDGRRAGHSGHWYAAGFFKGVTEMWEILSYGEEHPPKEVPDFFFNVAAEPETSTAEPETSTSTAKSETPAETQSTPTGVESKTPAETQSTRPTRAPCVGDYIVVRSRDYSGQRAKIVGERNGSSWFIEVETNSGTKVETWRDKKNCVWPEGPKVGARTRLVGGAYHGRLGKIVGETDSGNWSIEVDPLPGRRAKDLTWRKKKNCRWPEDYY